MKTPGIMVGSEVGDGPDVEVNEAEGIDSVIMGNIEIE